MSIVTIFLIVGVLFSQGLGDNRSTDTNLITQNNGEQDFAEQEFIAEGEETPIETELEPEIVVATRTVSEIYEFNNRLEVGSEGDEVEQLQGFLNLKGYYAGEIDGIFDEETRVGLRNTLIGECEWPDSTFGVLGAQAAACINNMEVETQIISTNTDENSIEDSENTEGTENISDESLSDSGIGEENNLDSSDSNQDELFIGDSGEGVITLQNILINLGYLASEADGNFDLATSLALKGALVGQCGFGEDIDGNYDQAAIACIAALNEQ